MEDPPTVLSLPIIAPVSTPSTWFKLEKILKWRTAFEERIELPLALGGSDFTPSVPHNGLEVLVVFTIRSSFFQFVEMLKARITSGFQTPVEWPRHASRDFSLQYLQGRALISTPGLGGGTRARSSGASTLLLFSSSSQNLPSGAIESGARRKKRAVHCFSSVNEAEELPTDEHTNGPMEVTDTHYEEEKPAALPISMTTHMPDSEKEELLTRHAAWMVAGYFVLAVGALLFVDSYLSSNSRTTRGLYYLTLPFLFSATIATIMGYIFVPILRTIKASQILRKEGPTTHFVKCGTPTMGGLFFIPVGVIVAGLFNRASSVEVYGVMTMTLVYAGIGLLDDGLSLFRKHNYGLPGKVKFTLQVVAGIMFFFWLESANVSSPYKITNTLPLPAPVGLLYVGKWYMALTSFCCTAMSNGVNLTDGLDGLAGGTVAVAFIGMAVAVLHCNPCLGAFGSSMAGACFGFLVHNRYKATVFMGDTGSLALGGGLAAMAACSGMFFPLFIASGVFVIETVSVMGQVFYFQLTKRMYGQGRRWLRMAPFHHHLELSGMKETSITKVAYAVGMILSILAACTGLLIS
ncbi:phospho-N-acetylmuramoyl-pentapeptide-transferase [Marchantia polymorpha subsp. ruderalis]|uniref:Phospho-N-acetylmuramoyl-pentapeptide-transferase n=4 Tax=Marchantia polymorpha TaxID=3197 RepID=A0AAF6AQX5_MARPO|nr:hypothetical protein MARPO_0001s0010 [Marchantia polymorpha]BBM98845.1 hypothetical protein Mp_1g16690 [Marchantia polymorpha subsp. ruderalis]|eukprot:PTQ49922.1 hypothetical protein MARPO_0001s0010 [Marchantia polymorpha]